MPLRAVLCLRGASYPHTLSPPTRTSINPHPIVSQCFPRHLPSALPVVCTSCRPMPSWVTPPTTPIEHSTLVNTTLVNDYGLVNFLLPSILVYASVKMSMNPSNSSAFLPATLRALFPPIDETTTPSRSFLPRPP